MKASVPDVGTPTIPRESECEKRGVALDSNEFIPNLTPEDVWRLLGPVAGEPPQSRGDASRASPWSYAELLGGDDETFARKAYLTLLGREPDPEGLANCLDHLRAGLPRPLILGGLRYSPEGRRHGAQVSGLWPRYVGLRLLRRRSTAWLARPLVPLGMKLLGRWERRRRITTADLEPMAHALHGLARRLESEADQRIKWQQALLATQDELRQAKAERAQLLATLSSLGEIVAAKAESAQVDALRQQLNTKAESALLERLQSRLDETARNGATAAELGEVRQSISHLIVAKAESAQLEALRQRVDERAQDGAAAAEWREVRQTLSHLILAKAESAQLDALRQQVDELACPDPEAAELRQRLTDLTESSRQDRESRGDWQANHEQRLASLAEAQRALKYELLDQSYRLQLLLDETRRGFPAPLQTEQVRVLAAEERHAWDALYAAFEDRFRGTREDIKERLRVYLPELAELKRQPSPGPVLDLGCGRGEWLELLAEDGFEALGVDQNRLFLRGCEERGLRVSEADALAYLRGCKPDSLGAVTAFHLIEHLPFEEFLALLGAARRALRPGGVLILETPNPENLKVGAYSFYIDPTHRNPIPPITAQLIVEQQGFVDCRVARLPAAMGAEDSRPLGLMVGETEDIWADYGLVARKAYRRDRCHPDLISRPPTEPGPTRGDDH